MVCRITSAWKLERPNHVYNLSRASTRVIFEHRNHHTLGIPLSRGRFKILFLGRNEFSCLVLEELYRACDVWDSITIATQPDEFVGRGRKTISVSPLKTLGFSLQLPVYEIPHQKRDFKFWQPPPPFTSISQPADHVVITASFGRILPASVLNRFAHSRCLNVHPSLLPAYRGPAPIQHALMNGESKTGVCVIEMMERSKGIDAGIIWGCSEIPISEDSTFVSLRESLAQQGGRLLVSVLKDMLAGKAKGAEQHIPFGSSVPIAPMIRAEDAVVNFSLMPAHSIARRYRAIAHQRPLVAHLPTGSSLQLHSPSVHIGKSILAAKPGMTIYHPSSSSLLIRCAEDSILQVPMVKQESKSLLQAKDWWNGMKGLGLVGNDGIQLSHRKPLSPY